MEKGALYAIGIFICFFALLVYNYGNFAVVAVKWAKKPRFVKRKGKRVVLPGKISAGEAIRCYIPIFQAAAVRNALYKSYGPFAVMSIISVVTIVLRLLMTFVIGGTPLLQLISIFAFYIGLILMFLTYGIITADCAKMYGFSIPCVILQFLFPCVACFWLQNNIATVMREMHKEETFDEHNADTVVKQRHSQRS